MTAPVDAERSVPGPAAGEMTPKRTSWTGALTAGVGTLRKALERPPPPTMGTLERPRDASSTVSTGMTIGTAYASTPEKSCSCDRVRVRG